MDNKKIYSLEIVDMKTGIILNEMQQYATPSVPGEGYFLRFDSFEKAMFFIKEYGRKGTEFIIYDDNSHIIFKEYIYFDEEENKDIKESTIKDKKREKKWWQFWK